MHVFARLVGQAEQAGWYGRAPAVIPAKDFTSGDGWRTALLDRAAAAKAYADPVVSRYQVGTAALGISGNVYLGTNLEFRGQNLSCTVHGEQAAVLNAWMHGETALRAIAVMGAPCGHCRQFLYETNDAKHLQVLLPDNPEGRPLTDLLPEAFGPSELGMEAALLKPSYATFEAVETDNKLLKVAIEEAARSYAPYSGNLAGACLEFDDGTLIPGRYAENVAFNPSLPPVAAALTLARLYGRPDAVLKAAAMVEVDAVSSQVNAGSLLLSSRFQEGQKSGETGQMALTTRKLLLAR